MTNCINIKTLKRIFLACFILYIACIIILRYASIDNDVIKNNATLHSIVSVEDTRDIKRHTDIRSYNNLDVVSDKIRFINQYRIREVPSHHHHH